MDEDIVSLESTEKQLIRLYKERSAVLSLPPEQVLSRILDAEHPAALVHSFSDEDFYLLIQEIGPEDAIEILSLASNRQWEFILDMESWKKERFDSPGVTRWIDYLMKADYHRLARWVLEEKTEFFKLFIFRNLELRIREHDEDPSDLGDDYITQDDVLYIRFIEYPFDRPLSPDEKQAREEVLVKFLKNLAEYDYPRYQHLIMESVHVIPAESEEEIYRLRNVRMAENGFLPYHDAVGIYQAIEPLRLKKKKGKFVSKGITDLFLPVPIGFSRVLTADNLFARALEILKPEATFLQIQTEFAALCNRIISADQKIIRDREMLRGIVKKACGYLSIGMERLSPKKENLEPARAAAMLVRHSLEDLFRVGFGAAQELKWRAEKWQRASWFSSQGLSLAFWGEQGLGVLGGLLIQRPLFFDNYQTGVLYREFTSQQEVEKTSLALEGIIALDTLFSRLNIEVSSFAGRPFFNFKNCLLTLWGAHHLDLNGGGGIERARVAPLTMQDFRRFFPRLWEGKKGSRRIRNALKADFLEWLCARSGFSEDEIRGQVGLILEDLFSEVENEYRDVSLKNLDPRYIHLFLIRKPERQSVQP